jgi:diguanylate cyclase
LEAETEAVIGHEALMRLTDEDGSKVSPTVFVPVAERNGAIVDLGLWVIDRACRDMADRKLGTIVSVNVSAVQLKAPNFALRLAEILARHQLAPAQLVIEITESTDIVPEAQAVRSIEQIRGLGVQVWLDDFGTGYAGLEWLRRVTFDTVKIDRSFLHDCQALKGLRMLQDMVRLLRNRGHTVLVEGVETEEQKLLLQRLGVDLMQGFYIGTPQAIEQLDNLDWSRESVSA